jgi:hypothetical protein
LKVGDELVRHPMNDETAGLRAGSFGLSESLSMSRARRQAARRPKERLIGARSWAGFVAQVDWPAAAFWPELSSTFPQALVILSVRPAEDWYRSASDIIFQRLTLDGEWRVAMRKSLRDRFCERLHDKVAMIDAYERHNDEVRRTVAPDRLVEWWPSDGWGPICEGLGMAEPDERFLSPHDRRVPHHTWLASALRGLDESCERRFPSRRSPVSSVLDRDSIANVAEGRRPRGNSRR